MTINPSACGLLNAFKKLAEIEDLESPCTAQVKAGMMLILVRWKSYLENVSDFDKQCTF